MTEPRTRTQYIHINSKHRHETLENLADLRVHLPQPIRNCYRLSVKSLTIANHLYNIRQGENTLTWAEFFLPPGGSTYIDREFTITIPTGYYTAAELCTQINTLINNMSAADHIVSSDLNEVPLGIAFSQNQDSYRVGISLVNTYGTKYFAPINKKHSIWRLLGWVDRQVVNQLKRKVRDLDDISNEILTMTIDYEYFYALIQAGTTASPVVAQGNLPAVIESPAGLYLTSNKLTSGGTYETLTHQDSLLTIAQPAPVLEFIQFTADRYSWVHYHATPSTHYHYLNDENIQDFDIQLRSENGVILNHDECGDYNLVIAFDCVVEPTYSPEYLRAYNLEAYRNAHTPERIIL